MINEFKIAVGKYPTGVCVITTKYQDQLWGFTANSFNSVSLAPPLVSFCLNKESHSLTAFMAASHLIINILSSDQSHIAQHFAQHHKNKFLHIDYHTSNNHNIPIINHCISTLECRKYQEIDCGDHWIFIAQVENTIVDTLKMPLVYYAKSYSTII